MRKRFHEDMPKLRGSIMEFLERESLLALVPFFRNIFNYNGYGCNTILIKETTMT